MRKYLPISIISLVFFCFDGHAGKPGANPAITELEPALAVRACTCVTCHAKINPSVITDFGHGDSYYFGNHGNTSKFGAFDGSVYGDFYGGEPNKTGWLTAEIGKAIIVPQAVLPDLKTAGAKLSGEQYRQPLQAASLAKYLQALESQKPKPAAVLEKKSVFIGAPNAATLEARFNVGPAAGAKLKFIKNDRASSEFAGIGLSSENVYYTNEHEVTCDGDLLIRGTLFLNNAIIATRSGCRIYVTGPIFLQGGITYKNLGGAADNTNLQLVSAEAILLGVGDKSCDAAKDSPLSRRLVSGYAISTFATREAVSRDVSPKTHGEAIYAQGKSIPGLQDASCSDTSIGFSRLLLNAPQVHSRYTGKFKGVVIAEIALFRLGKGIFDFDPVFKAVPILPRLKDSDYLHVE
jgi:hypothetical protein